jgi:hypothetical protein
MQIDKVLPDTWKEIEDLERETKALLETVRSRNVKPNGKTKNEKSSSKKSKDGGSKVKRSESEKSVSTSLTHLPQFDLSKSLGKTTVEILDDASPDATPRDDNDEEIKQVISAEQQKNQRFQRIEESYRNLLFEAEQQRVLAKQDTFIGSKQTKAEDIRREWARLSAIENNTRDKRQKQQLESKSVAHYLASDRSALQIQRLFRGHLGRQRVNMMRQIQEIMTVQHGDRAEDWIEVRDSETGDIWYYNTVTDKSQWDKPSAMSAASKKKAKKSSILPELRNKSDISKDDSYDETNIDSNGMKTLTVTMSLPTLHHKQQKSKSKQSNPAGNVLSSPQGKRKSSSMQKNPPSSKNLDPAIRREVDRELGLDNLTNIQSLTQPDGYFKSQLRTVVMDALLETRFDNVSTVLADTRWFDRNEDLFKKDDEKEKTKDILGSIGGGSAMIDAHKAPMVAIMNIKPKSMKSKHATDHIGRELNNMVIQQTKDLTVTEVPHNGFTTGTQTAGTIESQVKPDTMCFGCWSAGIGRKCGLHESGEKINPSETMLLCRNWDLDVLRRRHRSEEIQEIFMKREASLRYDNRRKAFFTVTEHRHPIYRISSQLLERLNAKQTFRNRIRFWLRSIGEAFRSGHVKTGDADMDGNNLAQARQMRIRRGILHLSRIHRFSVSMQNYLPKAPVTGTSLAELRGEIQFLFRRYDGGLSEDVDVMVVHPLPEPKQLYKPRKYHLSLPVTFPLLHLDAEDESKSKILPANSFIPDASPAGWIERLAASMVLHGMHRAQQQVYSVTPVTPTDLQNRSKRPTPTTSKYAVLGDKPLPNENTAVGGLPREILIYQIISTYYPPQYGNFMVSDKASVSPGVSPEISISFQSVVMPPTLEPYIERPLEHPLSHRRAPTISLNSSVAADNKHYYGINRPEQTGEQEAHGFRTTAWAPQLTVYSEVDPTAFTPGNTVSSLNVPRANASIVTAANAEYPFCEPSTRDNSTLDFYHLLLAGIVSHSKPQIFTALTVQEPGEFQKNYKFDAPMGHLLVAVYRSWGFTQADTIQKFETDDGISYWYHRKTGQTFWERPLYEDEEASPLQGGTVLDQEHDEAPSVIAKALDPKIQPRYNQGQVREQMLRHIENKKEAVQRRRAAAVTVRNARERGIIPNRVMPEQSSTHMASMENNIDETSAVLPGSRFDYGPNSSSVAAMNSHNNEGYHKNEFPPGPMEASFLGDSFHTEEIDPLMRHNPNNDSPAEIMGMYQKHADRGVPSSNHPQAPTTKAISSGQNSGRVPSAGVNPMANGMGMHGMMPGAMPGMMPGMMPGAMPGMMPGMGMNPAFAALTQSMSQMFSQMMMGTMTQPSNGNAGNQQANMMIRPEQWLAMGVGMGTALLQSSGPMVSNLVGHNIQQHPPYSAFDEYVENDTAMHGQVGDQAFDHNPADIPQISEEHSLSIHSGFHNSEGPQRPSRISSSHVDSGPGRGAPEPIGKPYPTAILSSDKTLDHGEDALLRQSAMERFDLPLTTMEKARRLQVLGDRDSTSITATPDVRPPKQLTIDRPANAEAGIMGEKLVPIVAYPELSTFASADGAPSPYKRKTPAGEGTSFVTRAEATSQLKVPGEDHLRRLAMPKPVGFFEAIEAKHVATQAADYLPQVPNLPQSRTIGRVKPRSAAADWIMISFDPWSAGRNPLSTEFVASLMDKADRLLGHAGTRALDTIDSLREATVKGAYVNVEDEEGLAQQRQAVTKALVMSDDYKKICSLCRHSKFSDVEQLISQPDWAVPIDYQDDQGNALLHVAAQNGSKRLAKLCLRKGADLNIQNLNGQTPLHFAYSYGYNDVGDYLVGKGADDSIRNKDGLTCYEGLGARELSLL